MCVNVGLCVEVTLQLPEVGSLLTLRVGPQICTVSIVPTDPSLCPAPVLTVVIIRVF